MTFTVIYMDEDHAYMQPDQLPVEHGYVIAQGLDFDAALAKMAEVLKADRIAVEQPTPTK